MPRNPHRRIVFWIDDKTLEKFLARHPLEQRNEIARQAFEVFLDGKTPTAQSGEMVELRKRKMLMDLQEKEETAGLRKRKLAAETAVAEYNAACLITVEPNPSAKARAAMKTRTRQIREGIREDTAEPRGSIDPHDKNWNRLFCPECGALFPLGDTGQSVSEAKRRYTDHASEKHRRTVTAFEADALRRITIQTPDGGTCTFCGHEHAKTEPRVCRTVSCLSGVR